jgi:uroporphyrinogen decarboxylase
MIVQSESTAIKGEAGLQNDLFLKALKGESVSRPPVWMMRQAGRYLPEYQVLRAKYDFFTRVQTPELAAEITIQPIDRLGVDAAILFSDILVVPQAMGLVVEMNEGKGPLLPSTISNMSDVLKLEVDEAHLRLQYVYDAIRVTKEKLLGRVPLIGFAGAPWTIFCYMVEGKGSKTFDKAKAFCYQHPEAAHALLQSITLVTAAYLREQAKAGVNAIQIFDSWGSVWDKADYARFSLPYLNQLVQYLDGEIPVILFAKGVWHSLPELQATGASALGVDWGNTAGEARRLTGGSITLQGNYDPIKLLQPTETIRKDVRDMIREFGKDRYIVNLGHGIVPQIPVEHAQAFVDAVKNYSE